MSMSANLHNVVSAEAWELGTASSLLMTNPDGCRVTVFMPYATAVAMADAFNARQPQPAPQEATE